MNSLVVPLEKPLSLESEVKLNMNSFWRISYCPYFIHQSIISSLPPPRPSSNSSHGPSLHYARWGRGTGTEDKGQLCGLSPLLLSLWGYKTELRAQAWAPCLHHVSISPMASALLYRTKAWWAGLLCEKLALDLHPDSSSAGKWWQVSHLRSLDYRATVAVRALWALWLELPCSSHSVVYTELAIAALGFHLWPPQSLWRTYGVLLVSQCG